MFDAFLDPIFRPLLDLGFFWAILILSFGITLFITLIYKFATDQVLMKRLKDEMKTLQKDMKKLKDNPQKAMAHQKKIMEKNMQYMKHSFKPTLYTFIPIIIIFSWLNAHLAYLPIEPNTQFDVMVEFKQGTFGNISLDVLPELNFVSEKTQNIQNSIAVWTLSGDEGDYQMKFSFANREYSKDLIISSENNYAVVEEPIRDSEITKIVIGNERVKPLGNFSLFGWRPGWLGTYILFSLVFSLGLRKWLKIS